MKKVLFRRRKRLSEERRDRIFYPVFGLLCLLLLLGFGVWHAVTPDKTYSEEEKRILAEFPPVSFRSLTSGEFMDKAEDYVSDQFPLRAPFMRLKTGLTSLLGDRESQGVCLAKDGTLISLFPEYDPALIGRTAGSVASFLEKHEFRNSLFLLVPTAVSLYPEKLPAFTLTASEEEWRGAFLDELPSEMTVPDVPSMLEDMKDDGEEVYYRTDHHWTTQAAYRVFGETAEEAGWTAGDYEFGAVSTDFEGSLVRKSGFTPRRRDAVYIARSKDPDLSVLVSHPADGTSSASYYRTDALAGPDKYEVFLGGNEPLVIVQTTADTDDTLLVFKDSYANCFLPFLFESYKSVTIVDPRYFTDTVSSLFLQSAYTDVLFLYNVQNLAADESLSIVLTDE